MLGYKLMRPHRMTDLVLEIMTRQAAERRARYEEVVRASTGSAATATAKPHDDEDAGEPIGAEMIPVPMHTSVRETDAESDSDVFGHGGELDNVEFESGHTDTGGIHAVTRLVPSGHSASSEAARTMPSGRVAGTKRGTHVWEWLYSHGNWRWVPASERCTGRPCFCDLQLGIEEVRTVLAQHDVRSAAEAQKVISSIEEERHDRRRAEREAMTAADHKGARHEGIADERISLAGPTEGKRARITTKGDCACDGRWAQLQWTWHLQSRHHAGDAVRTASADHGQARLW